MPDRRRRRMGQRRAAGRARASELSLRLGRGLKEERNHQGATQQFIADRAGVTQSWISRMERGRGGSASLETWASVAAALDLQLVAFLEGVPGAERPRDYQHLKRQELVIGTARRGGWISHPELQLDPDSPRSRSVDVALLRPVRQEAAVVEIWDFFDDIGAAKRSLDGKVASVERMLITGRGLGQGEPYRVRGLWVVRGTIRNRRLVSEFATLFAAAFPARPEEWLRCLGDPGTAMPRSDGMIWSDTAATRLLAGRSPR